MGTNLFKKHFRQFIIGLGNDYIKEENSEFLKREEQITKLNINTENEVLLFNEVHEPIKVFGLNCGTLDIKKAIKTMDLSLLYEGIYGDNKYRKNRIFNSKLYKMFDIVCVNVHKNIDICDIINSIIFVSDTFGNITISKCNNCLIVVGNVHGNINISNCSKSIFLFKNCFDKNIPLKNLLGCKKILLRENSDKYDIVEINKC